MTKKRNKHDKLVKKFLTNLAVARDFVEIHVPEEIQRLCDLSSIIIEPTSYIEDDLKEQYSDVLYRMKYLDAPGNDSDGVYVYVLVEHQSRAEVLMPLRILRYQLAIIQDHLDKYSDRNVKLPLVVPLVFYNGRKSPYPYSCNMESLFDKMELYKKLPLGNFKLVDLTVMEDGELLQHRKIALLEVVAKHIHQRNFSQAIDVIVRALQIAHANNVVHRVVIGALSYLVDARNQAEIEPLIRQISQDANYYGEDIMTYAESLRQEGRQEGRQETQREIAEIAARMLRFGIDKSVVTSVTHLSDEQIVNLGKKLP